MQNASSPPESATSSTSQSRKTIFSLGRRATTKENHQKPLLAETAGSPELPASTKDKPKEKKAKKKLQQSISLKNTRSSDLVQNELGEGSPIPEMPETADSLTAATDAEGSTKLENKGTRKFGIRRYAGKTLFGAIDFIRSPTPLPHLHGSTPYLRRNASTRSFTSGVLPPTSIGNGLFMTHSPTLEQKEVNDIAEIRRTAESTRFLFKELNALLDPVQNIEFSFDITAQNLMFRVIGEEASNSEIYDSYKKILLMDTGILIDRLLVFQIQSSTRGIKILEASSEAEKLLFFKIIQSSRLIDDAVQSANQQLLSVDDESMNSRLLSFSDDSHLRGESRSINEGDYAGLTAESAPPFFIQRWRRNLNDLQGNRIILAENEIETERIITHLGFLKSNVEALEEDIMYFSSQSEQRKLEMDRVYQESVDIQKKLDRIRAFVIDKRQTVLQEELPLRMSELAVNIKSLQRRENTKIFRVLFISGAIFALVAACVYWIIEKM